MTRFHGLSICVVGLIVALVGGCATTQPLHSADARSWTERRAILSTYSDWSLSGRIGITTPQEGWHASLDWVQQSGDYTIDLIGPLGQGRVLIRGDQQSVEVQTPEGRRVSANDPDRLVQESLGLRIPIKGLTYWVRGFPNPERPSQVEGDDQGRVTHIEQDGWLIDYPRYETVAGLEMPARINARRGDVSVRVAISAWKVPL